MLDYRGHLPPIFFAQDTEEQDYNDMCITAALGYAPGAQSSCQPSPFRLVVGWLLLQFALLEHTPTSAMAERDLLYPNHQGHHAKKFKLARQMTKNHP